MAKSKQTKGDVRLKAQALRASQQRSEKRLRNIVIGLVVVVVLALVFSVGVAVWVQVQTRSAAHTNDSKTVEQLLGDYKDGRPVLLSHEGVGKLDESLPTLTEYLDYSCIHCAEYSSKTGREVFDAAKDGKINIKVQPVSSVKMQYYYPATTASLIVAQRDPEHWVAFHENLLDYFLKQFNAGQGTVIKSLDKSFDQVKQIAKESGVSDSVISAFIVNGVENYLKTSTDKWMNEKFEGRNPQGIGTPELIKNDKSVIQMPSPRDPGAATAIINALLSDDANAAPASQSAQVVNP